VYLINIRQPTNKIEYFNRISVERLNFEFECYGECKDDNLQPSVLFFKFLSIKPELELELTKKNKPIPRLKLYVPDTIVNNDLETSSWTYTDTDGYVKRCSYSEFEAINKFKTFAKNKDDLVAIYKLPIERDKVNEENHIELLTISQLERHFLTKTPNPSAFQTFVKCIGPKAFICRSVWRRQKPPYVYLLTNRVYIFVN